MLINCIHLCPPLHFLRVSVAMCECIGSPPVHPFSTNLLGSKSIYFSGTYSQINVHQIASLNHQDLGGIELCYQKDFLLPHMNFSTAKNCLRSRADGPPLGR